MKNLLRIALIRPDEAEEELILPLLKPHNYQIIHVDNADDILNLLELEQIQLDAIVVPFKTFEGKSGLSVCIHIKAEETLSAIPLIPIFFHSDKAIIESLYGAGADHVVVPPLDSDLLLFQLRALRRQKIFFQYQLEGLRKSQEKLDLAEPAITTLSHKETQKSRSLALIAASSLYAMNGKLPALGETSLEDTRIDSPSLSQTLTKVLEFLDLLLDPGIGIKVSLQEDWNLKMNAEELFRLLGYLILFASDNARSGGSITIGAEIDTRKKIVLFIHSVALESMAEDSALNNELDGLVENLARTAEEKKKIEGKIESGLAAAIRLSKKYKSKIEYRVPSPKEVKLRLQLPLSVEVVQ